jgi:hypothetical protein
MAAWVYSEAMFMPISTGEVSVRLARLCSDNYNHDIRCGRTLDYYSMTQHPEPRIITTDQYGTLCDMMLPLKSIPLTGSYECVEFGGKLYMIASMHFRPCYRDYAVVGTDSRILARGRINYRQTTTGAECDNGKLYFATYGVDSVMADMPDWHFLDISLQGYNREDGQRGASICRGENGCVYYVDDGVTTSRVVSARDPRCPKARLVDHDRVWGMTNVDGTMYAKVYDSVYTVCAIYIYDERADAMIGTTAIASAYSSGICRLNPKKYN